MTLNLDRPEILAPPEHPPPCCTQRTITISPDIAAKTAQKHDYPSATSRRSYRRRTAVERTFSTIKNPATTDTNRGWCQITGLTAITLFLTCAMIVRNQRIIDAYQDRTQHDTRRTATAQPPKTRRRRRHSITELINTT